MSEPGRGRFLVIPPTVTPPITSNILTAADIISLLQQPLYNWLQSVWRLQSSSSEPYGRVSPKILCFSVCVARAERVLLLFFNKPDDLEIITARLQAYSRLHNATYTASARVYFILFNDSRRQPVPLNVNITTVTTSGHSHDTESPRFVSRCRCAARRSNSGQRVAPSETAAGK